jgi:hypothetical protein
MFKDIIDKSKSKYIYYGLTDEEVKAGFVDYAHNSNYSGKGVNTSLFGLVKFLIDHDMKKYITHYTKIPLSKFTVNKDIYSDKKYDMISVKIPFKIEFTECHKINYTIKESTHMFADILKEAVESVKKNDYFLPDKSGKIQAFDDTFNDDDLRKKVAYMFASSHEYDTDAKKVVAAHSALKFVTNYDWKEKDVKVDTIEGFNKPVSGEKTFNIAQGLKDKKVNDNPLIVVNRIHGFAFQSGGMKDEKVILLDGNGRLSALKLLNIPTTSTYHGTYTGDSEKDVDDIISGDPVEEQVAESAREDSFIMKNLMIESSNEYSILEEASKNKIETVPLTAKEKEELEEKVGMPYDKIGCIVSKNAKNGQYFAHGGRARSKFYDSYLDIPKDTLKFVASSS